MEEYNLNRVKPHLPHLPVSFLLPVFLVVSESKLQFPNHLKPQSTCTRGILVLNTGFETCFAHLCLGAFYIPVLAEFRRKIMKLNHLHQKLEVAWINISLSHDTEALRWEFSLFSQSHKTSCCVFLLMEDINNTWTWEHNFLWGGHTQKFTEGGILFLWDHWWFLCLEQSSQPESKTSTHNAAGDLNPVLAVLKWRLWSPSPCSWRAEMSQPEWSGDKAEILSAEISHSSVPVYLRIW